MTDTTTRVHEHYSVTDLTDRIKSALAAIVPEDQKVSKQFLQASVKSLMRLSAGAAQKDRSDDDSLSSRVPRPVENRPSKTSSTQKEVRVSLDDIARQAPAIPFHPQQGAHHHE